MKVIVFSDLHSNYYALSTLYEHIKICKHDELKVYFLGDIIGYLNYDHRVTELIQKMHSEIKMNTLAGNHDVAFFNFLGSTDYYINMTSALHQTVQNNWLYKNEILQLLPQIVFGKTEIDINTQKYIMSHGGISDVFNHYYYADKKFINQYKGFFEPEAKYVFGHTHRPFIIEDINNSFINVGSVGLSRDGDPRMCFLEINQYGEIFLVRKFYDVDKEYEYNLSLENKMKNRVYFGGNSKYIDADLLNIDDYLYYSIQSEFKRAIIFKRAVYIDQGCNLKQIYKIQLNNTILYLLRTPDKEEIFLDLENLLRSIQYEAV